MSSPFELLEDDGVGALFASLDASSSIIWVCTLEEGRANAKCVCESRSQSYKCIKSPDRPKSRVVASANGALHGGEHFHHTSCVYHLGSVLS